MKIQIQNPLIQKPIIIDVPIKEKNINFKINSIITYIISLNKKVEKMENELKNKSQLIEKQENEINIMKNKFETLENQIKELISIKVEYEKLKKLEIKKENRYFKDSNIIKLEEEDIIYNWFERKPNRFIKLLDSKKDGDTTNAFAYKCSNKCPIIVFVKTTNGYRFGGFTSVLWTYGYYSKDNKAFLFSLDKKEKYNITNENNATFLNKGNYFEFGDRALCIYNSCTTNRNNFVSKNSFQTVPKDYEINGGEHNFTVYSYEVYLLEY